MWFQCYVTHARRPSEQVGRGRRGILFFAPPRPAGPGYMLSIINPAPSGVQRSAFPRIALRVSTQFANWRFLSRDTKLLITYEYVHVHPSINPHTGGHSIIRPRDGPKKKKVRTNPLLRFYPPHLVRDTTINTIDNPF